MTAVYPSEQANTSVTIDQSLILRAILQQIHASDIYGTYRTWDDELLLRPYILSKKERQAISVDGDVSPMTMNRVVMFYRAIASCIEQETGYLSQVVIDINQEGFGWVLVFSGRLILVSKTLRDVHRFGFKSFEKLAEEGQRLIQKGIILAQEYADVCRL
jgi:probable nitrogen fixation protein